jgi:hypothetical protein
VEGELAGLVHCAAASTVDSAPLLMLMLLSNVGVTPANVVMALPLMLLLLLATAAAAAARLTVQSS